MKAKPFLVINCLSQGFAIAGPAEEKDGAADLEMIQWGLPANEARTRADDLNAGTKPQHIKD